LQDPRFVVATLAETRPALELGTLDLCFLAALELRASGAALGSFQEEQLFEIFEQVSDIVEPDAEQPRRRATLAIQRLRDQKLLTRVDGAGVLRAGEFSLTRLGAAIVECFLSDEALTHENLSVLMRTLRSSVADALSAARRANTPEIWRAQVEVPLRVTVADLVSGIERRQRGLDVKQAEFQQRIAGLLAADWFGAVESCQALLESSSRTLAELNEMLLRDSAELSTLLQEILEHTVTGGAEAAELATLRAVEQVERIAAWGAARQRSWSEYYQYVHRYLCDVVRLDPSRALSERLRQQLSGHVKRPFSLTVANAPPIKLLRDVMPAPSAKPPVKRPRAEREKQPSESAPVDMHALIARHVSEEVKAGARGLSEVTERVLAKLPVEDRFLAAGRVAEALAKLEETERERERPWLPLSDGMTIEEWTVNGLSTQDPSATEQQHE
jgi:chromosome partition protein MukF